MQHRYLKRATGALACALLALMSAEPALAQPTTAPAATLPALTAPGVSSELPEAVRERIDHIRYEQFHDVRGARIVLDDLVARFYEGRQFQPAWNQPGRLDALVAALDEIVNDGLDPA
ncbi:MAG TPA: hypothetical protein VFP48_03950, partial [Steroidobacteraceae bacterium]|nr:hypothetical protein [Steroidobacteraceae bacterium]